MKAIAFIFLLSTLSLHAQSFYHQRIGNFDYWTGPGYYGSGQRIGNQYYYRDNYGQGLESRVGNFDYFNYFPYSSFGNDDDN